MLGSLLALLSAMSFAFNDVAVRRGILYNSVYKKWLTLSGNTIIYPGHNYGSKPTMTMNENIKISNLLQASGEKDFINRMKNYEKTRVNNN